MADPGPPRQRKGWFSVFLECGGERFRLLKFLVKPEENGPLIVAPVPSKAGWRFTDHPSGFGWISKKSGSERDVAWRFEHGTLIEHPRALMKRLWGGAPAATMLDVYELPRSDEVTRRSGSEWIISVEEIVEQLKPLSRITLRSIRWRAWHSSAHATLVVDRRRGLAMIVTPTQHAPVGLPFCWGRRRGRVRATLVSERLMQSVFSAHARIGEEEG